MGLDWYALALLKAPSTASCFVLEVLPDQMPHALAVPATQQACMTGRHTCFGADACGHEALAHHALVVCAGYELLANVAALTVADGTQAIQVVFQGYCMACTPMMCCMHCPCCDAPQ